jgi:hypothetical protein
MNWSVHNNLTLPSFMIKGKGKAPLDEKGKALLDPSGSESQ